jgi:hypothetical protein
MEAQIFEKGKRVTRKHDKRFSICVSQDIFDAIIAKASRNRCSRSNVIRTAITNRLLKEIDDNGLIIEYLPGIMREIKRIQESVELSCELFIYWLKYFFAYADFLPNEEERVKQIRIGEIMKNNMLDLFKKNKMENKKSWLEQFVMEYFEFGSEEGRDAK